MKEELVEHSCPIEGEIMIEKGKPCNWCQEFDKLDKPKLKVVKDESTNITANLI